MAANETELERLIVRLMGDASGYVKMLDDAEKHTESAAHSIQLNLSYLGAGAVAQGMVAAHALEQLGHKFFELGHSVIHAWEEQEEADIRLRAALRANGREVDELFDDYAKFAGEMQRTTRLADEQVTALVKQAEAFDLTGDAAKRAVTDAVSLGAAAGVSAEATMRITTAMAKGDVERAMLFSRMIPQLRGVRDEQEYLATYQRLINAGWETEQELVGTLGGRMDQLRSAVSDLQEDYGKLISEAIAPVVGWLREAAVWFKSLDDETKETVVIVGTLLAAMLPLLAGLAVLGPAFAFLASGAALLGTMLSPVGLLTIAVAALAIVLVKLSFDLYNANQHVARFNSELERSAALTKQLTDRFGDETEAMLKQGAAVGDAAGRQEFFEKQLEGVQKAIKSQTALLKEADEQLKEHTRPKIRGTVGERFEALMFNLGAGGKERELDRAAMAEYKAVLDALEARSKLIKSELEKFDPATATRKAREAADEFTAGLRDQVGAFGMASREAALFKLSMQGATEEILAEARALDVTLTELEEHHKAMDEAAAENRRFQESVEQMSKSLEEQVATFGKTAVELRDYRTSLLEKGGAVPGDVAAQKALSGQLKEMEEWQDAWNRGKQVMESVRTPVERLADELDVLHDLMMRGAIDWETYERAAEKARVAAEGPVLAQRFPGAALRGSAEQVAISAQFHGGGPELRQPLDKVAANTGETVTSINEQMKILRDLARNVVGGMGVIRF